MQRRMLLVLLGCLGSCCDNTHACRPALCFTLYQSDLCQRSWPQRAALLVPHAELITSAYRRIPWALPVSFLYSRRPGWHTG